MNENITKWLATGRQLLEKLSPRQRLALGLGLGAAVLVGMASVLISQQDPYQVLYTDLQGEESRAIAKTLGEGKIPLVLSPDQSTISVPGSFAAKARMEVAKAGLPGQSVVGFEKFDSQTLGMSSYVQRIQYVRAVQGELTRSIQQLSAVKRARVHISIPPKKTFLEDEEPPKASVILELKRGQKPNKGEINGIAHLVASAVEGLKVANVSIVDTQGSFLHRPEDAGPMAGMSAALLENQHSMEQEYEHRVEEILAPVVGMGKVRAKVAAEIDASRVNTTEESFDADKAAIRSKVTNTEENHGTKPNPIGIPGSRSNLPGAEAVNPAVPMANTNSEKTIQNTSYSIPRKVQVTDKPSGNLKRLTVAVIVDGYYKTVNGVETFSPRSDDELRRLQDLVANSVGFDATRRDSITVSCLPFRSTELTPEDLPVVEQPWYKTQSPMKLSLLALLALLPIGGILALLLRGKQKSAATAAVAAQLGEFPKTVAQLEAEATGGGKFAFGDAALGEEAEPLEKKEEEDLRRRIMEKLDGTPKKGIAVIEEWLEQPDHHPVNTDKQELLSAA